MKAAGPSRGRRRWHWALAVAALEVGLSSCGSSGCGIRGLASGDPPNAASTPAEPAVTGSAAAAPDFAVLLPDPARPDLDWRAAIRLLDWSRAYRLLSALPPEQLREPSIQLVIGVAALESGRTVEAVAALTGLEEKLPLVREEVRAWYARAAAATGPFEEAAALLLASDRVDDAVLAAEAYRRAKAPAKARNAADRAVTLADRTRRDSAGARLVRAELAEASGDRATAIADLRWLVRERPEQALALLARVTSLGGTVSLEERLNVLEKAASDSNMDAIRVAFSELRNATPGATTRLEFAWAKTLLHGRRFAEALPILDSVARELPPAAAIEARYQAARAAARSGKEREAVTRFAAIASSKPPSVWAERAGLRHAETLLQLGRHREALRAFGRYFGMKKKGVDENATYGRALAELGAGEPGKAREAFAAMKKRATARRAGSFQELEGVAAARSGDTAAAVVLWLDLVKNEPLTWAGWMAHARLASVGHTPLPPLIAPSSSGASMPPPLAAVMPPAAALLGSLGLDAAAEARLIRAEDDIERAHPGREGEALCLLHGQLTAGRRRLQIGDRSVKRELLMRAPNDAEQWAWRCVYPAAFGPIVAREEQLASLPRGLIQAVMRQESAFDPQASSPVGARGLMQLMPTTARRVAQEAGIALLPEDVLRPDINIQLGATYLAKLLKTFDGNTALTAAAYNAGPHAVNGWLSSPGDRELDLWVAKIPFRETRQYVAAVVGNLLRYQFLEGGAAAVNPPSLALPPAPALSESDY